MSDGRVREGSWSGSERQRRPQGVCKPPKRKPVSVLRFLVPPGVRVEVSPVDHLSWRRYVTRKASGFERFESYRNGCYEFRMEGWLMRVKASEVHHRIDTY